MMIIKVLSKIFMLITLILIITITETSASVFNNVTCTNNKTFIQNSTFHSNLKTLLSSLSSNVTNDVRFFNTTSGKGSDIVYGLYMCRGDVPFALCRECIGFATLTIPKSCPSSKEAVIWYNECLLRYSYRFIFSKMETLPRYKIEIPMGDPVLLHSKGFYAALRSVLNVLPNEAAVSIGGFNKYAVKQENASVSVTLYGLAQCTPDLSAGDCRRCIEDAAAEFPKACCEGSIGETILFPSCFVRYETYPFYQHSGTSASIATSNKGGRNISTHLIAIIVVLVVILVVIFCIGCYILWIKVKKRRKASHRENLGLEFGNTESLEFDFATIEIATNNFSDDSKIGKGGYGQVYKGTLPNGQEIAVKRLSKTSGQGAEEFKNEVMLIAKLQHRNLVRLIGFCLEDQEKILIYEYVPNKSLDHFLFDSRKQKELTWPERYNIIKGIARGILYLHEDSRLKIIHRDIKPSNVLLDNNMNPKISDFGMARMVAIEQVQGHTNRVVGTYGYMSPEYAMHGQFSVKSDVFSFGVMVLEIISGKKNSCSFESCRVDDLLSYAWNQWNGETPFEMLDPIMQESYAPNEVEKCVQIGLLCVQENPDDRPTMGTVVSYLTNVSADMPFPMEPAFFMHGRTRRNSGYSAEHESYSAFAPVPTHQRLYTKKILERNDWMETISLMCHACGMHSAVGSSDLTPRSSGISSGTIVAIVVPISVAMLLLIVGLCFLSKRVWKKKPDSAQDPKTETDISTVESLRFDLSTLEEATNKFSDANKLGEGGFGEVYKGSLPSGQEIAVKRLSKNSGQGGEQFKNEVELVAQLQHRNLARLLGFCLEGEEKILVYEYVANKSLDYILFDPEKQRLLDWTRRYKIIGGVARGITYLHEDSRLKIIHRDLKASNILLDGNMNPKISDFGMAKLFGVDQTQGNTSRIVGTYGYMSPEYAMHGEFSIKSDVYSFGVLVLEIISGKKNSSFYETGVAEDLVSYAWKLWKNGTPLELVDQTVTESYTPNEAIRCIHIGLLCVQEDPEDRPTMATIVLMLDSYTVTLPVPKQPAFFLNSGSVPNMPTIQISQPESTTN